VFDQVAGNLDLKLLAMHDGTLCHAWSEVLLLRAEARLGRTRSPPSAR